MVASNNLEIYSALADMVYHRSDVLNSADQPITLPEISPGLSPVKAIDLSTSQMTSLQNAGLQVADDGYVYNPSNGFVGMIVRQGSKYVVVFRGTDAGNATFPDVAWSIVNGSAPSSHIDNLDMLQNKAMGSGTYDPASQAANALALADIAIQLAGGVSNVVVTGQSLGGGLAGIVGAVTGADAYLVSPAPFQSQIEKQADLAAYNASVVSGPTNPYATLLTAEFFQLTIDQRIQRLDSVSALPIGQGLENYVTNWRCLLCQLKGTLPFVFICCGPFAFRFLHWPALWLVVQISSRLLFNFANELLRTAGQAHHGIATQDQQCCLIIGLGQPF
jgi:hypothetical protein